jgi:hypothetical protein
MMVGRNWQRNQANDGRDHFERIIEVGMTVVKPAMSGRSAIPEIRKVTSIKNGKIYLDESRVAINYSGRLVVIDKQLYDPEK